MDGDGRCGLAQALAAVTVTASHIFCVLPADLESATQAGSGSRGVVNFKLNKNFTGYFRTSESSLNLKMKLNFNLKLK